MRNWLSLSAAVLLVVCVGAARAADYAVEPLRQPPPSDGLAADVAAQIAPTGFKVVQGKRTICEIWPAKKWSLKSDFTPSDSVLYPLVPGSLAGVLRFSRKGADFRGQDIAAGVYTLRYANQPVDGNHVGTFPTRDFLVMVPAADDQSATPTADMDLFKASATAAGSTHPAIMPLVKGDGGSPLPALRHLEEQDWWTVRFADGSGDDKVALELIVVGKAAE
jgi:hypothetical protein